ncbi:MAG: arylamine N-acetyltransferase [Bryobacterales bacterium]|nr:arylamine N-acetyltransferase [Bryobacterales bacterium]
MSPHSAGRSTEAIPAGLRDRVLERLGLGSVPLPDLAGLRAVYQAWCSEVPFDNVRKMIALRATPDLPLPGARAVDFFRDWLDSGAGGTCWPTSNALFQLLRALGFEAQRISGCMRDLGVVNHGSVKVAVEGREWLVDSSLLSNAPLPLDQAVFVLDSPVLSIEVEFNDSTHVVWSHTPPGSGYLPCRLLPVSVSHDFYLARYEDSRSRSPFNQRLYARRNLPGENLVLVGNARFSKTAEGVRSRVLTPQELRESLCREIGLSERLVDEWTGCGGLADSFAPPSGPAAPPVDRRPPSQRGPASTGTAASPDWPAVRPL